MLTARNVAKLSVSLMNETPSKRSEPHRGALDDRSTRSMSDILHTCFSGPALPASLMLILVSIYWAFVILGALDLEMFDVFEIDVDADAGSHSGWFAGSGAIVLRFLNLGSIPLMLWMTVFALAWWLTSVLWHEPAANKDNWIALQTMLRNGAVALLATKLITQPMTRLVDRTELRRSKDLVGEICTISTSEVTDQHGQAKLPTEGAPLLLHVRSRSGVLTRGDRARIVDYDPATLIYYVEKVQQPHVEEEVKA